MPDYACCTDYRVPVVLRELGVLHYAPSLAAAVDSKQEIAPGSQEEVEIRAATVVRQCQCARGRLLWRYGSSLLWHYGSSLGGWMDGSLGGWMSHDRQRALPRLY